MRLPWSSPVLLQGTQSVYIQVCAEGPHGERLDGEGMLGKSLRTVQTQGSACTQSHQGPKEQVGGSSWNAGGSDGSNDNKYGHSALFSQVPIPVRGQMGSQT